MYVSSYFHFISKYDLYSWNANLTFQMCHVLQTSHSSTLPCLNQIYTNDKSEWTFLNSKHSFISTFLMFKRTARYICHFSKIAWSQLVVSLYQRQPSLIPQRYPEGEWNKSPTLTPLFHITLLGSGEISFDSGLPDATCSHCHLTDWIFISKIHFSDLYTAPAESIFLGNVLPQLCVFLVSCSPLTIPPC